MTIAIGFRFSKGFLLCADSMYTVGTMKTSGRKVFRAVIGDDRVIVAIAGSVPHGIMFIEKVIPKIAALPPEKRTKGMMRQTLEAFLLRFYQKHIFVHPYFQREGGPDFYLIVGTWSHLDGLDCFSTQETTTTDIHDYYPAGIGQDVARLATKNIFRHPHLSLGDAVNVAVHVLRQTKENVAFCGGENQFAFLKTDGDMGTGFRLKSAQAEEMSRAFSYCFRDLFLHLVDPNASGKELGEKIEMMLGILQVTSDKLLRNAPEETTEWSASDAEAKLKQDEMVLFPPEFIFKP